MTVRTLHLYGALAERYGAEHPVAPGTIFDALRIVECNHPGFLQRVRRMNFHIAVGNDDDDMVEMPEHHLFVPRSHGDLHLVPAMEGGKSKTFKIIFSIVVGGALLATGIGGAVALTHTMASAGLAGGIGAGLAGGSILGLSYGTVAMMGLGIFLGGLNMLLTPTPKTDTADKKPTSFSFDGPGEIDDEGGPIHIILGEVVTGGIRAASAVESTSTASISQFQGVKSLFQGISGGGDGSLDAPSFNAGTMFGDGYDFQTYQFTKVG